MITVDLSPKVTPRLVDIDLGDGASVKCWPHDSERMKMAAGVLMQHHGYEPNDDSGPNKVAEIAFVREYAICAVHEWAGILDADGKPLSATREAKEALFTARLDLATTILIKLSEDAAALAKKKQPSGKPSQPLSDMTSPEATE